VIVVPSSIMRSRIASVAMPPVPAPRMMRNALYWAKLNFHGSSTRANARPITDAVRSKAMVASCFLERKGRLCLISDCTDVRFTRSSW